MTLQAPAISDARAPRLETKPTVSAWLRGIGVRQVRLACGLMMFSYIFSHFFNHALGNFSYDLMEAWLRWHVWWWRIPVVNYTLYTAAAIHFSLGLWALYQRRHFRYTVAEITQLILRPEHSAVARQSFRCRAGRAAGSMGATRPLMPTPLFAYWVARPHMVAVQFISADGGVDACLYRPFLLAAAKAVFQMGLADLCSRSPCCCRSLRDARHQSGRA